MIDLYLSHQKLVVIDNYLSSYSTTKEQKERLLKLRIEISNNSRHAAKIFQTLKLPRWSRLPEDLRLVFKLAAVGRMKNSFAVSCNMGPRSASRSQKASRGAADYIGRKLRGIPGASPEIAAVLENADHRKGCNPGLHFHAAMSIEPDSVLALRESLQVIFASDYVEVASNRAVDIIPIEQPGRWASYCCKTLRKANRISGAARFATNAASRAGEELYDEVMYWLRNLPSIGTLNSSLADLIRPKVNAPACPQLLRLIEQHREHRREMQQKRGQQTKLLKRLARENPDQFRLELVEKIHTPSNTPEISHKPPAEPALSMISGARIVSTPERPEALIERYRGIPGVGEWASIDDDEEQIFASPSRCA
ncbi:hypothetical protein [Metapseudomonas otitidis]|uniref:hypothetical protein n=1 Tax=Metapseudomonas otitidis TaxID=319939 RepID=UPI001AB01E07|nr:hypothetical protein [Pseudomonas otitidis]MBO2926449.1 hypothetical protein [Pseudomonas otitidis]QZX84956.1 hypothetical protein K6751_09695 [Pseudomonas otitidis]